MSGSSKSLVFMLALVLVGFMAGSAMGAAVGTSSTDSITNGVFVAGDTIPQAAGELSISYKKAASNPDSNYAGPSAVAQISVDTGYDLEVIGTPADRRVAIGDTASYAYQIINLGNATLRIYFDSYFHPTGQSDSGPGSNASTNWDLPGSYKVWTDSNVDGVWATGDTIITFVELASGASDTVVMVVVVPTNANDAESSYASILVTNRAPIGNGSTTGDGWQDSVPFTGTELDTQYDTTVTTVSGPNVIVSKTIVELTGTRSRPGDTLVITITFDNDGADSARGVELFDAVPANTRLVPNFDSGSFLGNYQTGGANVPQPDSYIRVYFDTDALGSTLDFGDTYLSMDSAPVTAIRWTLTTTLQAGKGDLSPDAGGDAFGTAEFQDGTDDGRVEFRVVIR
ncbi:DUF11 domain-containing protein [bacterium]|nr:DUF11 domain-containing protein [bacterium]